MLRRLGRTLETAGDHRARRTILKVVRRDGLREISHGRWEQMTRREVEEEISRGSRRLGGRSLYLCSAGGESGLAVTARALPVLVEIVRAHRDQIDHVVSHKATIGLLLSSLLGFDPRRYRDNLDQSPAALNIVDFRDAAHARLTLFNSTSHYSAAGHSIPSVPSARLSKWWNEDDEFECSRRHRIRRSVSSLGDESARPLSLTNERKLGTAAPALRHHHGGDGRNHRRGNFHQSLPRGGASPTSALILGAWVAGGLIALAGGFIYAELAARLPGRGRTIRLPAGSACIQRSLLFTAGYCCS